MIRQIMTRSFILVEFDMKEAADMAIYLIDHCENMPMQYTEIFKVVNNENFQ